MGYVAIRCGISGREPRCGAAAGHDRRCFSVQESPVCHSEAPVPLAERVKKGKVNTKLPPLNSAGLRKVPEWQEKLRKAKAEVQRQMTHSLPQRVLASC